MPMMKGEEMQDEWVEILGAESKEPAKISRRVAPAIVQEQDDVFEKRMDNWRRVVRGSLGGGAGGFCAGWARLYVQARDEQEREKLCKQFAVSPEEAPSRPRISVDVLDGWLIEAVVRSLPDYDQRRALQFWYVWQYPEHWIKSKLMLRRGALRVVFGRALTNVKNILHSINSAANIQSNNLNAGNNPRPESKDVP